jgi:hypothetical protein
VSADDDRIFQGLSRYAQRAYDLAERALTRRRERGEILGFVSGARTFVYANGWPAQQYVLGQGTITYDGEPRTGMDLETAEVLRAVDDRIPVLITLMEVNSGRETWLHQWLRILDDPAVGDLRETTREKKQLWRRNAFGAEFPGSSTRARILPVGREERDAYLRAVGSR